LIAFNRLLIIVEWEILPKFGNLRPLPPKKYVFFA